jgi:hypothetical protein
LGDDDGADTFGRVAEKDECGKARAEIGARIPETGVAIADVAQVEDATESGDGIGNRQRTEEIRNDDCGDDLHHCSRP